MRIAGTAKLTAPPAEVYDSMQDGRVLAATIPGVQSLDQLSDDHYKLSLIAGVAAIKGTYDGEVRLSQQNRPESFVMTASGAGAPGTVRADVTIRLEPTENGGTLLSYDADAVVGGMVGGVGQRMITGVAKKMAGVFFNGLDGVIANGIPEATPAATAVVAADGTAPEAATGGVALPIGAGAQRVGAGPAAAGASAQSVLVAAAAGAAIALAGVLVGGILVRKER
ncbi:carbon monoxide dehydrogenase [Rhodococcus sp. PAMC28707]|uniref:SRPBCC family protein n=1 Tax=unclassified Rhodococcus (in: high G+C Gram-positive bacteria) TaxID=192944 RepID=UPI00109DB61C|nr:MULTISPECIES: carbon monoxide dehydrogenase subunit G [unclassified Rhodococcus (in: high G+C Gram-positive bacteria)]QCB51922.1 carbon monoxide dehydrogenase [Rhodococcus sp. PAMC28705]QCB59908.1 carbon monoxide dehydrogenase [Rhodococcus sp. PAMC28707]